MRGISQLEHKCVIELLQKIICSKSEVEYDELYGQLLQCGQCSVKIMPNDKEKDICNINV